MQRARKANAANDKASKARRAQDEEQVEEKKKDEGGGGGEEGGGRGGGGKGVSHRDEVRKAGATCLCVRWRERKRGGDQGRKGGEGGERKRVGKGKKCAAGVHTYFKSKATGK